MNGSYYKRTSDHESASKMLQIGYKKLLPQKHVQLILSLSGIFTSIQEYQNRPHL